MIVYNSEKNILMFLTCDLAINNGDLSINNGDIIEYCDIMDI